MGCSTIKEEIENIDDYSKDIISPEERNDPTAVYKIKSSSNSTSKQNQKQINHNFNSNLKIKSNSNIKSNNKVNVNSNININTNNGKQKFTSSTTKDSKNIPFQINNQIKFVLEIKKGRYDKKDYLQNKIYFLDNTDYSDDQGFKHFHDGLREINQTNAELIINNVKYPFQKFLNLKEEGTYNIILNLKIALTDCTNMFHGSKYLTKIDFSSFETKYINSMHGMFWGCENLKSINLSELVT